MATEITTTENTSMAPTITAKPVMALAFDTTTGKGKKRLFNALNTAESLNDADIKQLTLSGIIVQPTEPNHAKYYHYGLHWLALKSVLEFEDFCDVTTFPTIEEKASKYFRRKYNYHSITINKVE